MLLSRALAVPRCVDRGITRCAAHQRDVSWARSNPIVLSVAPCSEAVRFSCRAHNTGTPSVRWWSGSRDTDLSGMDNSTRFSHHLAEVDRSKPELTTAV